MKTTRRKFLKSLITIMGICSHTLFFRIYGSNANNSTGEEKLTNSAIDYKHRLGVENDGMSNVYLVKNGTPVENMNKLLGLIGGVEKYIGLKDIVIIKPNAQRYNQGMTNTNSIRGFIDSVLSIPEFCGEIIIAENHQIQKDDSRGWTTDKRNGQFNLNELVRFYQENGHKNVTKYHWHNAGSCSFPLEGNAQGHSRVKGVEDGDGYVWLDNCYYLSPSGRKCLMSYPVFTSSYSGVRIDLKKGAWKHGKYTNQPIKFINFSALNHHGRYAGVSASIKNLMGVVDMTCGFPGNLPENSFNMHHIGVSKIKHFFYHTLGLRGYRGLLRYKILDFCYRNFHHTGGALGFFMQQVRCPDFHFIAADLVGWGDRKNLDLSFRPKALLASTDPVALDYIAAKKILYPGTPKDIEEESGLKLKDLNNPDVPNGAFKKFLIETYKQGVGNIDPEKINVILCDLDRV